MKSRYFTRITLSALALGIMSASASLNAATVPAGTELAAQQELVRNNGSEPASLDPHKVESDVEFGIIRDLFDGLVAVKKMALLSLVSRNHGKTKTTRYGCFICALT
jgi:oligopeptide transport system substrate-binding protein